MKLHPVNLPKYDPAAESAQWLLSGHNRFNKSRFPIHTYHGPVDGLYGTASGHAADKARYWLGYPKKKVNIGGVFGDQLYSYLLPTSSAKARRLPLAYRVRKHRRVAAELKRRKNISRKAKAVKIALTQVGYHEAGYSNYTKYGAWFGYNGVAWCAIFLSWALAQVGINIKTASAEQWYWWATQGVHGLSVTHDPEPGDIVSFFHGEGHCAFFVRWVDRSRGTFETVEGNTSCAGGSWNNGGEVCHKVHSLHDGYNPRFVRVPK